MYDISGYRRVLKRKRKQLTETRKRQRRRPVVVVETNGDDTDSCDGLDMVVTSDQDDTDVVPSPAQQRGVSATVQNAAAAARPAQQINVSHSQTGRQHGIVAASAVPRVIPVAVSKQGLNLTSQQTQGASNTASLEAAARSGRIISPVIVSQLRTPTFCRLDPAATKPPNSTVADSSYTVVLQQRPVVSVVQLPSVSSPGVALNKLTQPANAATAATPSPSRATVDGDTVQATATHVTSAHESSANPATRSAGHDAPTQSTPAKPQVSVINISSATARSSTQSRHFLNSLPPALTAGFSVAPVVWRHGKNFVWITDEEQYACAVCSSPTCASAEHAAREQALPSSSRQPSTSAQSSVNQPQHDVTNGDAESQESDSAVSGNAATPEVVDLSADDNETDLMPMSTSPARISASIGAATKERKVYVCTLCDVGYLTKLLLRYHCELHSRNGPYICPTCSSRFKTDVALLRHCERDHTGTVDVQKCLVRGCSKGFTLRFSMFCHMARVHARGIPTRHDLSMTGDVLLCLKDEFKDKEVLQRVTSCDFCGLACDGSAKLQAHVQQQHLKAGKRTFNCDVTSCEFTSSNARAILDHQLGHLKRNDGKPTRQCDVKTCTFTSQDSQALEEQHQPGRRTSQLTDTAKIHKCDFTPCQFTSSDFQALKKHLMTEHNKQHFVCEDCGKLYSTPGALKLHTHLAHVKKYSCSLCDELFEWKQDLVKHQTQVHPNDTLLLCQYCAFTAKTPHSLRRHEECRHEQTSVAQLVCDCCGLAFNHAGELRRHVQKKHPENYAGKHP